MERPEVMGWPMSDALILMLPLLLLVNVVGKNVYTVVSVLLLYGTVVAETTAVLREGKPTLNRENTLLVWHEQGLALLT